MTSTATYPAARLNCVSGRPLSPDRILARFDPRHRSAILALARRHPRLEDLVASFPALLFALARPRFGLDPAAGIAQVIEGRPLAEIAALAGVPLWLRRLEPEMLRDRLPFLPDNGRLRHQMVNHLPIRSSDASAWFDRVGEAARWGDTDFVLWVAREGRTMPRGRRTLRRHGRSPTERTRDRIRLLALWAYFSSRPILRGYAHVAQPWHPRIGWNRAVDAAGSFASSLRLALELGDTRIDDVWFEACRVDGYDFEPLRSADDLNAEAAAMEHCVRGYGHEIRSGASRIWSVRRSGAPVATVELGVTWFHPIVRVVQVAGPRNRRPAAVVVEAITSWTEQHGMVRKPCPEADARPIFLDRRLWRDVFRPFWLHRRRIPDWLPLEPPVSGVPF